MRPVYDGEDKDFKVCVVEGEDGYINLDIRESEELTFLRSYLKWTFCLIPKGSKARRRVLILFAYLTFLGLLAIYPYDLGAFGHRTLVQEEMKETLTAAKNAFWSLRFALLRLLSLLYFTKPHLENTFSRLKLTPEYWKKAQQSLRKTMVVVVLFVFVVPLSCRAIQMNLATEIQKAFSMQDIALNLTLSFLSRFFGLPVFVVFVYIIYIIYTQIRMYKKQIQEWKRDQKGQARNEFNSIILLVRNTEKAFQKFLLAQVVVLLVVLIPAVLSFAERINKEGHYSQTSMEPFKQSAAAGFPSEKQVRLIVLSNITQLYKAADLDIPILTVPNVTENQNQPMQPSHVTHIVNKVDKFAIAKKVIANALGLFFEMLVLCSLPLFLLAKVSKVMAQLPEAVRNLNFGEQQDGGYMIQSDMDLEIVQGFLKHARGFRVLGMDLTTVKVALITLVMPFLTTVIHLMMAHVDIVN